MFRKYHFYLWLEDYSDRRWGLIPCKDQAVIPTANDHADTDLEVERGPAIIGVVEDLAVPDLTKVVAHNLVAGLDDLTIAGVEHLDLKPLGGRSTGEGEEG